MSDLNSKVIAKIKQVRLNKGITQRTIANSLHLSSNAYSRIENGNTQLTINNLEVISEVLGLSISKNCLRVMQIKHLMEEILIYWKKWEGGFY